MASVCLSRFAIGTHELGIHQMSPSHKLRLENCLSKYILDHRSLSENAHDSHETIFCIRPDETNLAETSNGGCYKRVHN